MTMNIYIGDSCLYENEPLPEMIEADQNDLASTVARWLRLESVGLNSSI